MLLFCEGCSPAELAAGSRVTRGICWSVPYMEGEKVDCVQRQAMTPLQSSRGGCEVLVAWLIDHLERS